MALTRSHEGGQSAFTLIELLVVIGLLAVFATISVAGYSAASRGMADRGAIQATVSTLRIAQQVCEIDRVPTKVLFFNQRLTTDAGNANSAHYQGSAIAIKQTGRITIRPSAVGGLLVDEFADWHQSYPMLETGKDSQAPGMRIYRMKGGVDDGSSIDQCSVLVQPCVFSEDMDDWMIQTDAPIDEWCKKHGRKAVDNAPQNEAEAASYVPNGNNYVWGFKAAVNKSSSGGLNVTDWQAGDAYGIEIARYDLPKGYIFGSSEPKGDGLVAAGEVHFDPEKSTPTMSESVQISAMRPGKSGALTPKKVETVDSKMLDDSTKN